MTPAPERLTLRRHRDLRGRERRPWARRVLVALLALVVGAGLANVFGQVATSSATVTPEGRFSVDAPTRVRGGLLYMATIRIAAREDLRDATVVLAPGWVDGTTVNTIEPQPVSEASRDGRIALRLGHVPAGRQHLLFLHFQVNPTQVGRRSQDVDFYDGERLLASVRRRLTIWP